MPKFEKGTSGNPGGRPRGSVSIVAVLTKRLGGKGADGKRYTDALVDQLLAIAMHAKDHKTRLSAIMAITDRVDGKVVERLEHSGPNGAGLAIRVIYDGNIAASSFPAPCAIVSGEGRETI